MSILNKPICGGSESDFNLGKLLCDIIHGKIDGLIFTDPGFKFTVSDLATQDAFIAAATAATRADRGGRIYPLWDITNVEDRTQEATKVNVGNNTTAQVTQVEAIPAFDFQHRKGMLFHRQLSAAASLNLPVFIVDDKNTIYGVETQSGELVGFSVTEFMAGIPRFGSASAVSYYPFGITFASAREHKEGQGAVITDSRIKMLSGLINIKLTIQSVVGDVVKVKAYSVDNSDISVNYDVELSNATAWVVKNTTGSTATVTSAFNSIDGTHDLTLSGTPWTGASVGAAFTVALAAPSILSASPINMDGYDSIKTSFQKV